MEEIQIAGMALSVSVNYLLFKTVECARFKICPTNLCQSVHSAMIFDDPADECVGNQNPSPRFSSGNNLNQHKQNPISTS